MKNMIKIFTTTLMIIAVIMVANPIVSYAAPKEVEPGVWFDAEYYAANNPDVVAVFGTDPGMLYLHYKTYGKNEGRLPMAPISTTTTTATSANFPGVNPEYLELDGSPLIKTEVKNGDTFYYYYGSFEGSFEEEVKMYVLQMINNERAALGREPLILRDDLVSYSQVRVWELTVDFSHNRPNGEKIPYGEVITGADGYTSYEVACNIVEKYKNSLPHWTTLMAKYKYVGIGEVSVIHIHNGFEFYEDYNIINVSAK